MEEFEVSYEVPCRLVVRAKCAENSLEIAQESVWMPFVELAPLDDGKEGIVEAEAEEGHGFEVLKVVALHCGEVKA